MVEGCGLPPPAVVALAGGGDGRGGTAVLLMTAGLPVGSSSVTIKSSGLGGGQENKHNNNSMFTITTACLQTSVYRAAYKDFIFPWSCGRGGPAKQSMAIQDSSFSNGGDSILHAGLRMRI